MADDHPLPEPTAEQFLQEYERYRNQKLILHHHDLDKRTQSMHPQYTLTRLVEGDLIPVNDRAGQQLAKRCADLYDSFLASATTDANNTAATDTNTITTNNPPNRITTATITPAATPRTPTTPQHSTAAQTPSPPSLHPPTTPTPTLTLTPEPSPTPPLQQHPPPLLHISPTQLYEYTTALHSLLTPTPTRDPVHPTTDQKQALAEQQEQALADRQQALAARDAAVRQREGAARERERAVMEREREVMKWERAVREREEAVREREAAAVLLFDEALLARQLREVWLAGFERGVGQAQALAQRGGEGVVVGGGGGGDGGFGGGSGSGSGSGGGVGDGAGNGYSTQVVALPSYLAIIEGVLAQVCKARTLAGCPPPAAEQQLEALEAELARLLNEGRAVMAGTMTAPDPVAPGPVQHAHVLDCSDGRQNWTGGEGSHGRPKVDTGKERMVLPSGNEGVDMHEGAALLMALKKKATMLGLSGPAGGNRLGEGGRTASVAMDEGGGRE